MIELLDCLRAISDVAEEIANEAPIQKSQMSDIEDGATGLFIVPTNAQTTMECMIRHDTYEITLAWYATRENDRYIDLLACQEKFLAAFTSPIPCNGCLLYPENISFDVDAQEGTMFFSLSVDVLQLPDEPADQTHPDMDELLVMGADIREED